MRTRDENKELAIREKAIEMIVKEGFDGLSMQKLAKAAGVSPATIYIYFKDREDLILQICAETSNNMLDASLKNFDPEMPFAEGLAIQWKNRAAYFMEHPVEVLFLEQIKYSPLHDKTMQLQKTNFKESMQKFVHNAIQRKELLQLPFEVYWSIAFAPLYQLVKYHTQGKSHVNSRFTMTDKVMTQTLSLVLKALKP